MYIPMLTALSSRQAGMGMAKEVAEVPQREKLGAREPPKANLMALVNFPHGSWRALLRSLLLLSLQFNFQTRRRRSREAGSLPEPSQQRQS